MPRTFCSRASSCSLLTRFRLVEDDDVRKATWVVVSSLFTLCWSKWRASIIVTMPSSANLSRIAASTKNVARPAPDWRARWFRAQFGRTCPPPHEIAEDADQIAAYGAADAAVVHLEDFFLGVDDQLLVHADLAEFVSNDAILWP